MSTSEEVPITPATNRLYVIIGGCGFLGRHITEYLLKRGEKNVRIMDLRITKFSNVPEFIQGDITKMEDCINAFKGAHCVFNTASPLHTGGEKLMYKVNVDGTKNVIEACQKVGVKQLVYTSSASVVFDGKPIKNVNEERPYCKSYIDPYNKTKSIGERIVREANGKNGLSTVCIRPSGIFGPRDAQFFPGLIGAAKAKSLGIPSSSFQIGDGSNYIDLTYVDNLVYAHVLASDKMTEGSAIAGQVYFITNGDPRLFWKTSSGILKDLGLTPPSIVIPYWLGFILAYFIAICVWILSPIKTIHPTFTPFRLYNACNDRTFSIEKAKKELGYKAYVSLDEGLKRTTEYFKKELAEGRI